MKTSPTVLYNMKIELWRFLGFNYCSCNMYNFRVSILQETPVFIFEISNCFSLTVLVSLFTTMA